MGSLVFTPTVSCPLWHSKHVSLLNGSAAPCSSRCRGGVDLLEISWHADRLLVATQADFAVVSNEQVGLRQEIAVPIGRGFDHLI